MQARHWIAATLLVGALAAVATAALQQEKKQEKPVDASAADDPMMQKMMEFMTPGEGHKALEAKIGTWNAEVTMFQPGAPPETEACTSEAKWILGGRYVEESVTGILMGMPFQGRGLTGYDNMKKKYVGAWIDSMGTGIVTSEGTYDASTHTFAYTLQYPDVMSGKYVQGRSTEKRIDADHWTMEMFQPGPDGKEYKSMEIHYKRAKGARARPPPRSQRGPRTAAGA
jgi:hypothetical protein